MQMGEILLCVVVRVYASAKCWCIFFIEHEMMSRKRSFGAQDLVNGGEIYCALVTTENGYNDARIWWSENLICRHQPKKTLKKSQSRQFLAVLVCNFKYLFYPEIHLTTLGSCFLSSSSLVTREKVPPPRIPTGNYLK